MKKFLKFLLVVSLVAAFSVPCLAGNWRLVTATHVVKAGETVRSIAQDYIKLNTYGPREINEFESGIRELNEIDYGEDVSEGQVIKINYWIAWKEGTEDEVHE